MTRIPWPAVLLGWIGVVLLGHPATGLAWGERGHRMINRLAVDAQPAGMPEFFRQGVERISWLGPEPDRWKKSLLLRQSNGVNHYIDLDAISDDPAQLHLPPTRWDATVLYARRHLRPEGGGYLPYEIVEDAERLRIDFARWRATTDPAVRADVEANILYVAGILGHYVGDSSMPLHTTVHHHGRARRTVGPDGTVRYTNAAASVHDQHVHERFEDDFVDRQVTDPTRIARHLKPPAALRQDHLLDQVTAWCLESFGEVDRVYQLDARGQWQADRPDPEAIEFVEVQIARGAQRLADLYWTAWRNSQPEAAGPRSGQGARIAPGSTRGSTGEPGASSVPEQEIEPMRRSTRIVGAMALALGIGPVLAARAEGPAPIARKSAAVKQVTLEGDIRSIDRSQRTVFLDGAPVRELAVPERRVVRAPGVGVGVEATPGGKAQVEVRAPGTAVEVDRGKDSGRGITVQAPGVGTIRVPIKNQDPTRPRAVRHYALAVPESAVVRGPKGSASFAHLAVGQRVQVTAELPRHHRKLKGEHIDGKRPRRGTALEIQILATPAPSSAREPDGRPS